MAKKKKKLSPPSFRTQTAQADVSFDSPNTAKMSARPAHFPRKPRPVEMLFDGNDVQRFLDSFFKRLTVSRILIVAIVSLLILVPAAFAFRGKDLRKVEADKLFAAQQWEAAAQIYDGLIDYLPVQREVALSLAECRLEMGQTEGVLDTLAIALKYSKTLERSEMGPFYARANSLRAWYWFQMGNDAEGLKYALLGLKSNRRYPRTNYLVGDYYVRQGNLEKAGTYFSYLVNVEKYRPKYEAYLKAIEDMGETAAE